MKNCIVKTLKESVNADIPVMSSIRIRRNRNDSVTRIFSLASAIAGTETNTFVRATDGLTRFYIGNKWVNQAPLTDGLLWYAVPDVVYPQVVEVEVFPRYNLKKVYVNNFDGIDKYMTNLEELRTTTYDTPLDEDSVFGNIEKLNEIPSLKIVHVGTDKCEENVTGDVGKLGNLVNLEQFFYYGSGIYGYLNEALDGMVENGRQSGELSFKGRGNKVMLVYNGVTVRVGTRVATHQDTDVYGWRIGFDSNGWSVLETYTTY